MQCRRQRERKTRVEETVWTLILKNRRSHSSFYSGQKEQNGVNVSTWKYATETWWKAYIQLHTLNVSGKRGAYRWVNFTYWTFNLDMTIGSCVNENNYIINWHNVFLYCQCDDFYIKHYSTNLSSGNEYKYWVSEETHPNSQRFSAPKTTSSLLFSANCFCNLDQRSQKATARCSSFSLIRAKDPLFAAAVYTLQLFWRANLAHTQLWFCLLVCVFIGVWWNSHCKLHDNKLHGSLLCSEKSQSKCTELLNAHVKI